MGRVSNLHLNLDAKVESISDDKLKGMNSHLEKLILTSDSCSNLTKIHRRTSTLVLIKYHLQNRGCEF
jgi:hypothetical protein